MNRSKQGPLPAKAGAADDRRFVLAVGAANMDIAGSGAKKLAPGDSTPGQVRSAAGGVARNVAENLARLGHRVCLLSAVGDDLHGHSLLESTRTAGVDVRCCRVLGDAATSTYVSLHGPDGEMVAAVNDMAILERITPEHLARYASRVTNAAALMLDCNLSEAALAWLFAHARDAPVFVDGVSAFKCRRVLPWLGRVFTLKANRLEAQALWGRPVRSDAAVKAAARWLHAQGVQQVVLSLGERGVYWSESGRVSGRATESVQGRSAQGGTSGWHAAPPVIVASATGAGDALMAGLLHAYLHGVPLEQAVNFAVGCAAVTLTADQANHPGLSVAKVQQLLGKALTA